MDINGHKKWIKTWITKMKYWDNVKSKNETYLFMISTQYQ